MTTIDHSAVLPDSNTAGNRSIHVIQGLKNVADETARAAAETGLLTGDIGRVMRQTGGTTPGWYLVDSTTTSKLIPICNGAANTVLRMNSGGTNGEYATLVNANIDAAAAIAGTKISPAFGSQNISTTGTLAAGATTLSGTLNMSSNSITNATAVTVAATDPLIYMIDTNAGTDVKSWRTHNSGGTWILQTRTDADAAGNNAISITRSTTTVTGITLSATTVTLGSSTIVADAGKIGLFTVTPVVQPSTTGTTTGFTSGSGTNMNNDSTSTGGTGSAAYTFGDVVLALKQLGALAA